MKSTLNSEYISDTIKDKGEKTAREAAFSPLVETLTRVGFGTRGLIYFVMGVIAVQVALGGSSAPADQQGALAAIGAQTIGRIFLMIILVGLVGYALWGVIRTLFDPLRLGRDAKGIVQRLWSLVSAASYASLTIPTYGLLTTGARAAHNGAQTAQTQNSVTSMMWIPWGRWIVGLGGVIWLGIGISQIMQGFSHKFDKQFELYDLNHQQSILIRRLGRIGTAARGVTLALVGIFLVIAAYRANPAEAVGIDGALLKLSQLPYGPWLLGVVAVGLMAFGIYSMTGALWFRFKKADTKK